MIKIEQSVVINRPVEEVFAYLSKAENATNWQSGVLESEQTSEGPVDVGTTSRVVRKLLGRRIESTSEITEFEQNKMVASKTTSGPIPVELRGTYEAVDDGTKVTIFVEAEVGGFFKLAEAVVGRTIRKQIEADFDGLKGILEAEA